MENTLVGKVRPLAILGITLFVVSLTSACSHNADQGSGVAVPNFGFENGILDPWTPFQAVQPALAGTPVHSGKFSLAESVAKGSVYQDVKGLTPGAGYTVSAWVCGSADDTAAAQIAVFDLGSQLAAFSGTISPTASWQVLKFDFKASAASQGIVRIHLFRNEGNGTIFWDDVQVARTQ
jgi:hypothetical protein